tara:strand:+ start:342 stop:488 length:147 start_codon:yes stop_codon:yes gene_type:complete
MYEVLLCGSEISGARRFAVIAEVDVFTPEPLEQLVIGPGIVSRGNTGA